MLRPAVPADTPALLEMARGTGVFLPHEIDVLDEVLADCHRDGEEGGQVARVWEADGVPAGFFHLCPVAMTLGTWELWWIVVSKGRQGAGLGGRLLSFVEQEVRDRGGLRLFIETSSTPHYEGTRRFYLKHGYAEAARLPDYYRVGDDKVVFFKPLDGLVG